LTINYCFVVKQNNLFAHGETIKKAIEAMQEKIFEDMDEDERINLFLDSYNLKDKYPAKSFYSWHNKLTGSCEFGRKQFAQDHGIDLDIDEFTVKEFINLTKNSYGKEVILKIAKRIK